jgi:hypothetical protein
VYHLVVFGPDAVSGEASVFPSLFLIDAFVARRNTKYMARRRSPPSQGWQTFLRNHADGIAAMDLFVVPTISFRSLYGLLIMGHGRRQSLWRLSRLS